MDSNHIYLRLSSSEMQIKTQRALQDISKDLWLSARLNKKAKAIVRLYSQNDIDDIVDTFIECANEHGDIVRIIDVPYNYEIDNYELSVFCVYTNVFQRFSYAITLYRIY